MPEQVPYYNCCASEHRAALSMVSTLTYLSISATIKPHFEVKLQDILLAAVHMFNHNPNYFPNQGPQIHR